MSQPLPQLAADLSRARHVARRVVMVTSAETEATLVDVAANLATVCAETGQRVVLVSTAGLASPGDVSELPMPTPLWSQRWPYPLSGPAFSTEEASLRLLTGPVRPEDVEDLLGDTGIPGVSRLDLRPFVGHPAKLVIRVPEVLAALRQIVDVVILEVPSYLSVHHGEALTPLADAVLVVGERRTTRLNQVRSISAALKRLGAPVVGMALTRAPTHAYDWGHVDSELGRPDAEPSEERDPTEQIPVVESTAIPHAMPVDEGAVVDHAAPEA